MRKPCKSHERSLARETPLPQMRLVTLALLPEGTGTIRKRRSSSRRQLAFTKPKCRKPTPALPRLASNSPRSSPKKVDTRKQKLYIDGYWRYAEQLLLQIRKVWRSPCSALLLFWQR